jgi:hypothetical protein
MASYENGSEEWGRSGRRNSVSATPFRVNLLVRVRIEKAVTADRVAE